MTNSIDISGARHPYEEWKHARAERIKWKTIEDQYWQEMQDRLEVSFDAADELVIDGRTVWAWDSREGSRVSVAELRKRYPDIAAEVTEKKIRRAQKTVD